MSASICFFIGHADISETVFPALCEAVERHIHEYGVTEFCVGNHGRFDALARRALKDAKARHPHIRCQLVTAYHPGSVRLDAPAWMDGIVYPLEQSTPPRFAIPKANRAMIDDCSHLIAAVNHPGRAREFLDYAFRREKRGLIRVENLFT